MNVPVEKIASVYRGAGQSPEKLFLFLKLLDVSFIDSVRVLREAYDLDLAAAKEIGVRALGLGKSLSDYQAKLAVALEQLEFSNLRPASPD